MGSPDARQIDGIGGAHPLTSKVAIVGPCAEDRADVEYLFLQVGVDTDQVSDRQNCGNLLAGVAPFALERGLREQLGTVPNCSLRILMRNTGTVATARFSVVDGAPVYEGDTAISGVPGSAAAIHLDFDDLGGGSCGAMLPTGNVVDVIDGVECTLIDNGMPVVVMRASDLGITGTEAPAELEANDQLRARLEAIRLTAGPMMNLGDVADTTVPKMTMVSAPTAGGHLSTRTFIPHRCHEAIGVLGAVSVATAALLPGSPASELLVAPTNETVRLEHPTGFFDATVDVVATDDGGIAVERAGIVRTARKLMDGTVFPRTES
jgi:4-oxalomesaconate tautomerase